MGNKLYPPQIEGSLPAFTLRYDPTNSVVLGAYIQIPFTMNSAVSVNQISAFALRLRTTSSGSYLFPPVYSDNYNLGTNIVTFGLSQSQAQTLNEGQFYKVQIAYCGSASSDAAGNLVGSDIGYFSTVGIIKCTSMPKIYINNLNDSSVNFFTNDYIGVYDQTECNDQTEKVYSYEFKVYDENDEVYYTSGEKLHQTSYDTNYNFSIDKISINDFITNGITYSIEYVVNTMNGLTLTTPRYRITNENLVSPNKKITILPEADEDSGHITVKFKGDLDLDRSQYYILNDDILASEHDNLNNWIEDMLGHTVINVAHYIENYNEKISFLKQNTLFKCYQGNGSFIYAWHKNTPIGKTKYLYNGQERYIDTNLLDITDDADKPNLPYFISVASGRDLIKNISYQYVKDNFINVNTKENYLELEDKKYYLIASSPFESYYFGSYILSRASDIDNYSTWFIINRFKFDQQAPSSYEVRDITVEHGRNYKYSLQQTNIWGLTSSRIYSDIVYANFEDMYLYDGEKLLKIRYNPKVDSYKTTLLEQKTDTIGGKFPYITRNGATWYKQFPIGGLIAQELDEEEYFINRNYGVAHRHSTSAKQAIYDDDGKLKEEGNIPKNATHDFRMFSNENIVLEREFKNIILDWLNDGNPKLFKSPYEGNFIVRLMQNTLTPVNELGRMLHNFTSQAYEIADCTYENLVKYGFIKSLPPSDYTGLWRTYNLTDSSLKNGNGDIEIKFDVGLNTFTIQDMMPGDIIYLQFYDNTEWEPIMIGITGSYTYTNSDRLITKLKIKPQSEIPQVNDRNTVGILNCYYQGVRISAFDAIINQQLITIPSQQFVGVNPWVEEAKRTNWYIVNNYGQSSFSLSQDQYEELQNYNLRDYLDEDALIKDTSGTKVTYKINNNFIKVMTSFEPGELLERINLTLNHGETNKIKLLNIEQLKFRLRDVIPVYVVDNNLNATQYDAGRLVYGEKSEINGQATGQDYQMVAVSPYGYPYRIEELTKFEMLDPFCIFEVFEMDPESHMWVPINDKRSPYYDPFYQTWLYEYNPNFKINYTWKKIAYLPPNSYLIYKCNIAKENKIMGRPYNEDDIYDYIIEYDEALEQYYYIDSIGHKHILNSTEHFDLYFKEKGQYYTYGTQTGVLPPSNIDGQIYYVKEYETEVSLTTIKEKEYKNLKEINSIQIGTGVMAEMTFQIKVIDYYTEVSDAEVKAAKDAYLEKRNFNTNLMKHYSIISDSDYNRTKYSALYNAYNKLLNGTNQTYLSQQDKNIIQSLLKNSYEIEQLKLLKLYNVQLINELIDLPLLEQILNYKAKYKEETKFGLDDLKIFTYEDNYYAINNNVILQPMIKDSEDNIISQNEDNKTFYSSSSGGVTTYFAIDKDAVLNLYSQANPNTVVINKDLKIIYAPEYTLENINNYVIEKNVYATTNGTIIIELDPYEENLYISKWDLLNENQKSDLEKTDLFVSIEEVEYINIESTPIAFYEQKELELLSGEENIDIEGVGKKLNDLTAEVAKLNEEVNDLIEIISTEENEYLQVYNNLQEVLKNYNEKVYQSWVYNEICKLAMTQTVYQMQEYFSNTSDIIENIQTEMETKILRYFAACRNLYNIVLEETPKIERYQQMMQDASADKENLQDYLETQIIEKCGNIVLCTLVCYKAIDELYNNLLTESNIELFQDSLLEAIVNYNKMYEKVVDFEISGQMIKEIYEIGLETYIISLRDKFIKIYNQEESLMEKSSTYVNTEAFANLSNWYEDLQFIYNYLRNTPSMIPITIEDNTYNLYNITARKDNFQDYMTMENIFPIKIDNETIQNPISIASFIQQLNHMSAYQLSQIEENKNRYTYFYRTSIMSKNNIALLEADATAFNTFIFYPLSDQKDLTIEGDYHSNLEYYNSNELTDDQRLQILTISTILNSKILEFLNSFYKPVYGEGQNLINMITSNYLADGKSFNTTVLNNERAALIDQSVVNEYTNFMNKIYTINSEAEPLEFLPSSRPWFLIKSDLAQSLVWDENSMAAIGLVTIDEETGISTIQPGIVLDYLNALANDELELKQKILAQAIILLNLYQQQYDNYTEKLNSYNSIYTDYETIYRSYANTEELNYYQNQDKTLAQYREEVRRAWWAFLSILDYKYTLEKERGLYS